MKKINESKLLVIIIGMMLLVIAGNILNHRMSAKEEVEEPVVVEETKEEKCLTVYRIGDDETLNDAFLNLFEIVIDDHENSVSITMTSIEYNRDRDFYEIKWDVGDHIATGIIRKP